VRWQTGEVVKSASVSATDASDLETRFAGEVHDFDPAARFGRKEARRMDRFTQFAMAAASEALAASRLQVGESNRDRIGVYMGTGIGGVARLVEELEVLRTQGPRRVSPFLVPLMLPDSAGAQVAIRFGLRGPNLAIVSACATGANAIGEAVEVIRRGAAEAMLAGGAEASLVRVALAGLNMMNAVSRRNDAPQKASRPFDLNRDGFVAAEGAGVVVLEALEAAQARRAQILAEVLGYGITNDAYHISAPAEDGSGAARCMELALRDAALAPQAIDYINAHGTSTPLNDKSETAAIKRAFGEHAYRLAVSSTKSMTGHLLGAAGGVEAVFTILALREGLLPPTLNYETPDPDCDLDYVPNVARHQAVRHAMSNSFGFGGHNACLIFGPPPG
jgi:3-oxoacyl-[acyl-carrier-protein] synthase II